MVLIRPLDLRCSVFLLSQSCWQLHWVEKHETLPVTAALCFFFLTKDRKCHCSFLVFALFFFCLGPQSRTFKLWSRTLLDNHWQPFVLFGFWQPVNHIYCLNMTATCHWFQEIKHRDADRLIDWSVSPLYLWLIWWRANAQPAVAVADIISSWRLLWLQADGGDNIKTIWAQPLRTRSEPSTHVYTEQPQANYLNDRLANALIK